VSRRLLVVLVAVLSACSSGGASATDVGFLQDMADHHEQAVRMALLITGKDDVSPITHSFAVDVIASQRYELGVMDAQLRDADEERGAPGREVMAWMDMGVPFDEMPGMATQASLNELASATGADADALFFRLMIEHHRGGIHMAEYAEEHGGDDVRDLAERIVFAQEKEIREMERAQAQLGLSSP
jgi:uncharacterized protein (DUF305 family)